MNQEDQQIFTLNADKTSYDDGDNDTDIEMIQNSFSNLRLPNSRALNIEQYDVKPIISGSTESLLKTANKLEHSILEQQIKPNSSDEVSSNVGFALIKGIIGLISLVALTKMYCNKKTLKSWKTTPGIGNGAGIGDVVSYPNPHRIAIVAGPA